ncbi:MAG: amidohydrolase family protein [Deltaproteobacteria bacterium]|jgi:dihydropyrimidinase|nr:amidohydrolase family protein [Deltaproteobacteria bacterium]
MEKQQADIIVANGMVVNSTGIEQKAVVIKSGKILSTPENAGSYEADRVIDANGKFVLPGIIDAHLHPVYADRIDTLSKAAATGGITTLIPYVGAVAAWGQGGDLVDSVKAFIEEGESSSILDFGIHCTFTQKDIGAAERSIPTLIEMGIISFKGFTAYKKRGMKLEDEEILKIMGLISKHSGLFATHCENGPILDLLEDSAVIRGDVKPEYYPPTHPGISEAEAVFRVLSLAQISGCKMYLPHLSAKESLDVLRLFKSWNHQTIYAETCPHYLVFTDEELKTRGSLAKMSPPLRRQADVDALWRAVQEGLIDVIGSDAAGHTIASNEPLHDDIFSAPHGIPGLDTMFTVTYSEGVNKGRITLPHLVKMTCENPARIFGLYPKKGALTEGADADVVIFDPALSYRVPEKNAFAKVDYSLYEGLKCLGAATMVMQRGKIVMADGEIKAQAGQGVYLPGALGVGCNPS